MLVVPHEDPATHLLHMCWDPFMLSGWQFNLCKPLWAQVSGFCWFSSVTLTPRGPSSTRFPKLSRMFGCGSLQLFLQLSFWMKPLWWQLCSASVCKYSLILLTVSWWTFSHGMSLKKDQSLVGHSLNFCSIFTPAHWVGRTNCSLKFCSYVGVPVSSRRRMVPVPDLPLLGVILIWDHSHRLLGVCFAVGF